MLTPSVNGNSWRKKSWLPKVRPWKNSNGFSWAILLPQSLRTYAGIEKDIVLVGVLDRFEIWAREKWDQENLKMEHELEKAEVREEIASLGL